MWPLDAYFEEGARVRNWLASGVVKHHRTTATYVTALQRAGLQPTHLVDWAPTDAHPAEFPERVVERERPAFLLLAARRIA